MGGGGKSRPLPTRGGQVIRNLQEGEGAYCTDVCNSSPFMPSPPCCSALLLFSSLQGVMSPLVVQTWWFRCSSARPFMPHITSCPPLPAAPPAVPALLQGVMSPLAGQMFFRASLFGAFGESKRWLGTNADGTQRALQPLDFYKAGAMTGARGRVWVKKQVGLIRGQWRCSLSLRWHMQQALQLLDLSKVGAVVGNRRGSRRAKLGRRWRCWLPA